MKTLIIYESVHHGNTEKVAKAMAGEIGADLKTPVEVDVKDLDKYDLIGLGSGIYGVGHHENIRNLVKRLPRKSARKVFVFSTSGTGSREFSRVLISQLQKKGYNVIGDFACKGYGTYGIQKLTGGISKERPNEEDLANAREFIRNLV